jgi:beta-lactamase class A
MKKLTLLVIIGLLKITGFAQIDSLKHKIAQITVSKKADVGVAIYNFENNEICNINGNKYFPMQSVFKLHLALTVLNEVDRGKLSLNQKIEIKESDLRPVIYSPLREKYPKGNVSLSLQDVLYYSTSLSDNNACDILFRLIGGTKIVNNYIHRIGVGDVSIKATEEEMSKGWDVQFRNKTTPLSAIELLKKLQNGGILSQESYQLLWKMMAETPTGKMRLKANLPKGTVVVHKAGTSGRDGNGVSAAVNDIGIIILPNSTQIAICVFVTNSKEDNQANEKIIADIAKVTWDYYVTEHK